MLWFLKKNNGGGVYIHYLHKFLLRYLKYIKSYREFLRLESYFQESIIEFKPIINYEQIYIFNQTLKNDLTDATQ